MAFIVCKFRDNYDAAAEIEWAIAFYFSLYVLSFVVDLYPAVRTKHSGTNFNYRTKSWDQAQREHKMEEGYRNSHAAGNGYHQGAANF